jgi:hypothetical protein
MIMMVILVVIEKHIIFTVRKWPEQHTMGKTFAILKTFVITRSAYAGAQRYSSSWTGDNIAT